MRSAKISRQTAETEISVEINLDGSGSYDNQTGVGFFDHMLDQLARHSLIDMTIRAKGDYHIDDHHTVEDTGIALGQALAQALGDKKGIRRYGECHLPMDDAQVRCALDLSARPYLVWNVEIPTQKIGSFDTELVREFSPPLPPMAASPCISTNCMVLTAITSSKPPLRPWPAPCVWRWKPTRANLTPSRPPKGHFKRHHGICGHTAVHSH